MKQGQNSNSFTYNNLTETRIILTTLITIDLMQAAFHAKPSVLWRCRMGSRKGIWPVKTEWWGTGMLICLEQGANDLHMVHLMPLPPHHLLLQ